jgi:2-(1,2-epoxy-1,2-dihydrophenyl)acetyl-CoA isomerase
MCRFGRKSPNRVRVSHDGTLGMEAGVTQVQSVRVDRHDGVVTITLHRPERKNAITAPMVEEVIEVLNDIGGRIDDRAVIFTGAGEAFCSGMDLSARPEPDELTFMRRTATMCNLLHNLPQPTIARVPGAAMGFGCNLAFCCDLVIAADTAVFGEIFADRGLAMDGGASWSLPRLVGLAKAKELLFFGARIPADEALQLGLINRLVSARDLDKVTEDWADRLARGPRLALSLMKAALNTASEKSFAEALESEAVAQALSFRSPEAKEGMRAFAERRPPEFHS